METWQEKIDSFFKGIKTYATTAVGLIVINYFNAKGYDVIGYADTIQLMLTDAVTWASTATAFVTTLLRKVMPDKQEEVKQEDNG